MSRTPLWALILLAAGYALAGCGGHRVPTWPATATSIDAGYELLDILPARAPGLWLGTCFKDNLVAVMDATHHRIVRTLTVRSGPAGLVADPERNLVYCLHLRENAISLLGHDPLDVIQNLGTGNMTLASGVVRPGVPELWICDGVDAAHALTLPGLHVKERLHLGRYPQYLAFSPDGHTLWVTLKGENALSAFDVAHKLEIARVPVGIYPHALVLAGRTACVSNTGSNDVSLVDTRSYSEWARVKVRDKPVGLALQGKILWVSCEDSYRLSAIDLATGQAVATVKAGFYPGALRAQADGTLVVSDPRHRRIVFLTPHPPPAR